MFLPQEGEGHAGCWREEGPRKRQERQKAVATEAEAMAGTRVSRGGLVQRAGCGPRRAWTCGFGGRVTGHATEKKAGEAATCPGSRDCFYHPPPRHLGR